MKPGALGWPKGGENIAHKALLDLTLTARNQLKPRAWHRKTHALGFCHVLLRATYAKLAETLLEALEQVNRCG